MSHTKCLQCGLVNFATDEVCERCGAPLPSPWASKTFRATDVGAGIVGQHIDVFTGTGRAAEQETFRITSNDNRVCFKSNAVGTKKHSHDTTSDESSE